MSDIFGGDSSGGGGSLADLFSGAGSSLSDLAGGIMGGLGNAFQAFAGGPSGSAAGAANTSSLDQSVVDPSSVAQAAIAGPQGQDAPTSQQTQNPQGQQGQGQNGQGQFAPPSAVDQLKKALQNLRQNQRENPYQTGGPQSTSSRDAGQNSSMLNRAARIPTGQVPPAPARPADDNSQASANLPSPDASNMEFMNDNTPPPSYPSIDPADAVKAGLRSNAPDTSGTQPSPPPANENTPPTDFQSYLQQLRAGRGPSVQGPPPTLDLGQGAGGGGLGGLAGLARMMGLGPAGLGAAIAMKPTPAETGEAPTNLWNQRPSGVPDPTRQQPPDPSVTKAPETGKPVQTVNPKTKKPVDPKSGAPLPTHKKPLPTKTPPPTHKGHYEPATGEARDKQWAPDGQGPIQRDVSGGQGIPPMLGQLARMALPMLMMGLMGGGRGRGRGFVGGRWGHPGGFGGRNFAGGGGYWPYHHPTFGWGVHGYHPGGGWRPMDPRHMRQFMGGGAGGGPLGYSGDGGQGGDGSDQSGDIPPQHDPYYDKASRYASPGTPSSTVEGKGPDGQPLPYTGQEVSSFTDDVAKGEGIDPSYARRILAGESSYGQNYTNNRERDGIPSYGPFQLHDSGPGSVGYAFKQVTGEDPADPKTWKDQVVFALKWAKQHGWSAWGAATSQGIGQWAGIDRKNQSSYAWGYGQKDGGKTPTGGSAKPQVAEADRPDEY